MQTIEESSPSIDLQKRGIADLLARQQEEYDRYPKAANGTPPIYQLRRRAAHQAALNAISSPKDRRPNWLMMWVAAAIALSTLLFLKLKFG